ncbi:hypothetical protein PV04_10169 [Phialophora macrospora]|uniref:Xylanolytic transcriptional activator regulatory domain-containing protein n=1 Tax=Phialophora macrospora TaxID=1851006 RepID=A0A0D2F8P9_9EURO|nr:hypothetical protein PV04_10169 [Phialophora macrospora]
MPAAIVSPKGNSADVLTRFFENGVISCEKTTFAELAAPRIVYVGTAVANFNYLVEGEQPGGHQIHYPFPHSHTVDWNPSSDQLAAEGIDPSLARDLSSFPMKAVRDAIIDDYFSLVHPGFVVINERDFRRQYDDARNPPPLLLFQAVLLVGSHVCTHPMVSASRPTVMATLFRRVRLLFRLRHQNDRTILIQTALLLSWHVENSDTVSSNGYHWIGIACRTAFGLGLHRDVSLQSERLIPLREKKQDRLLWWTVFQAEVFSALEYGRPCMIREEDFDQHPLSEEDFIDDDGQPDKHLEREFFCLNSDLCFLALDILRLQTPKAVKRGAFVDSTPINSRLAQLASRIPTSNNFWGCQLRINYYTVLLLTTRTLLRMNPLVSQPTEELVSLCHDAACNILTAFDNLAVQNLLGPVQPTWMMALLAAIMQFRQDLMSSIKKRFILGAQTDHARLWKMHNIAQKLSAYHPNAETIRRLCEGLYKNFSAVVDSLINQTEFGREVHDRVENDLIWQDIFDENQLPFLQHLDDDAWMNTFDPAMF